MYSTAYDVGGGGDGGHAYYNDGQHLDAASDAWEDDGLDGADGGGLTRSAKRRRQRMRLRQLRREAAENGTEVATPHGPTVPSGGATLMPAGAMPPPPQPPMSCPIQHGGAHSMHAFDTTGVAPHMMMQSPCQPECYPARHSTPLCASCGAYPPALQCQQAMGSAVACGATGGMAGPSPSQCLSHGTVCYGAYPDGGSSPPHFLPHGCQAEARRW